MASDQTCDHEAYEVTATCTDCGANVDLPPDPYEDHLRDLASILDIDVPEDLHPQTVWEHIIEHLRGWVRETKTMTAERAAIASEIRSWLDRIVDQAEHLARVKAGTADEHPFVLGMEFAIRIVEKKATDA